MTSRFTVEARSRADDKGNFDRIFAEMPDQILKSLGKPAAGSTNLWLQLLAFGEQRTCEFWISSCAKDGSHLARIGADVPQGQASQGSIGFFDCVDSPEGRDAAKELISEAIGWLKSKRIRSAVGPMDFNSWFNYRFKVRPVDEPSDSGRSWEPIAPNFHKKLFEEAGFSEHLHFSSLSYQVSDVRIWDAYLEKLNPEHESVVDSGYIIRPIASGNGMIEDLRKIFELSNIAFADNPMFEKIPFPLFSGLMLGLAVKANIEASRICLLPDGQAVAFAFCFSHGDELVYKTVAVHPDHRSKGIANALTWEISAFCRNNKITRTTGALIRSGNISEKIGQSHGSFAQPDSVDRYVLLRRMLE